MAVPTRFTQGIGTQKLNMPLGDYPFPDPFHTGSGIYDVYTYMNDYTDMGTTVAFTITGTSSTFALVDGISGIARLTPGAATTATTTYRNAASFQFIPGQKFWFLQRCSISANTGAMSFGLMKSTNAVTSTTDSILFVKAAGATTMSLVSTVNNVATTLVPVVASGLTTGQYIDLAFYYDGFDLDVFAFDTLIARIPNVSIGATGTKLTNALMTPITTLTPTASEFINIDYTMAAVETLR